MKKVPSKSFMTGFRIVGALVIFLGAGLSMGLVWDIADVLMGIMAIINIPVIIILGKPALIALEDYAKQKKAGKNPVFKAETVGLKGKTDYWQ
jgi:AGCS family alanine or glycine:cation symporter